MRSRRVTSSAWRRRLAVVAAGALALVVALPASAAIVSRDPYSGSDAWSYSDCGFTVDVTSTYGGTFTVRSGPDPDAFFAHDSYWFREVHVRRSDGKTGIVWGKGNFLETRAIPVGGTLFKFRAVNAGQLFTISNSAGNVLLRDRGMVDETIVFDTLGDGQPGGEFVSVVSTRFKGSFPSLEADLCSFWAT